MHNYKRNTRHNNFIEIIGARVIIFGGDMTRKDMKNTTVSCYFYYAAIN
jgi:hypothetical protein